MKGTPWSIEATKKWGEGVENDIVTKVAVVPKPVQKPHPPIFQPFASSERTVRWCAAEGITPVLPPLHPAYERRLIDLYAEVSGKPPGEGIGVLRDVVITDSDDEAIHIWNNGPKFCLDEWFAPFGFDATVDPTTGQDFTGDFFAEGLAFVGTTNSVTRQLEYLRSRIPFEWVFAWHYNGLVSDTQCKKSLERWATEIVPRVERWE